MIGVFVMADINAENVVAESGVESVVEEVTAVVTEDVTDIDRNDVSEEVVEQAVSEQVGQTESSGSSGQENGSDSGKKKNDSIFVQGLRWIVQTVMNAVGKDTDFGKACQQLLNKLNGEETVDKYYADPNSQFVSRIDDDPYQNTDFVDNYSERSLSMIEQYHERGIDALTTGIFPYCGSSDEGLAYINEEGANFARANLAKVSEDSMVLLHDSAWEPSAENKKAVADLYMDHIRGSYAHGQAMLKEAELMYADDPGQLEQAKLGVQSYMNGVMGTWYDSLRSVDSQFGVLDEKAKAELDSFRMNGVVSYDGSMGQVSDDFDFNKYMSSFGEALGKTGGYETIGESYSDEDVQSMLADSMSFVYKKISVPSAEGVDLDVVRSNYMTLGDGIASMNKAGFKNIQDSYEDGMSKNNALTGYNLMSSNMGYHYFDMLYEQRKTCPELFDDDFNQYLSDLHLNGVDMTWDEYASARDSLDRNSPDSVVSFNSVWQPETSVTKEPTVIPQNVFYDADDDYNIGDSRSANEFVAGIMSGVAKVSKNSDDKLMSSVEQSMSEASEHTGSSDKAAMALERFGHILNQMSNSPDKDLQAGG